MPTDESGPFDPEPQSQADFLRAVLKDVRIIKEQVIVANGRLSRLERAGLIGGGLLVGLVGKEVVPLLALLVAR